MSGAAVSRRSGFVLPIVVLAAAGAIAWGWTLRLPFTGVDIWPSLVQAREAASRPSLLWINRYLEGLWDGARFWRPGTTAFVALERLAFGAAALPFHAVRLVLAVCTALIAGAAAARGAPARRLAFLVAGLMYLLHPIQVETLPATARDADTLFTVFALGGLVLLARALEAAEDARPVAPWLGAGCAALLAAPLVKEPGLLSPLLGILVLRPFLPRAPAWRARLVASGVLAAGLLAQIAFRFRLLGTVGRYERELPITKAEAVRELLAGLVDHQRWGLAIVVFALLAVVAWSTLGAPAGRASRGTAGWAPLRDACLAWSVIGAATYIASPVFRLRYAEGILAPLAVLCGAACAAAWGARATWRGRLAGSGWAAVLLLVLVPGTPIAWRYPQWELTGRAADMVCDETAAALRSAQAAGSAERTAGAFTFVARSAGGRLAAGVDPFPFQPAEPAGALAGRLANVAITAPYAVNACLEGQGFGRGAVRIELGTQMLGVRPADLGDAGRMIRGYR